MVARDREIVANLVHNVDDPLAVRKRAEHSALNGVAIVHKCHVVSANGVFHLCFVAGDGGISHTFVVGAVDVVGVEHDDVVGVRCGVFVRRKHRRRRTAEHCTSENH